MVKEDIIIDISKNDLKNKVEIDDNGVDEEKLVHVQKVIAGLAEKYYARAIEDIEYLKRAYKDLIENLDDYPPKLETVHLIAHNMKGQGASFNYHMVTYIGDYLCRFINRIKGQPTKKILDIINIHINAINLILVHKIKGKTDPQGDEIMTGLESTLEKYAPDIVDVIHNFRKNEEINELKYLLE